MPRVNEPTRVANALGYLGTLYRFGRRSNTLLRLLGGVSADAQGDTILVGQGWRQEQNFEFATNLDFDLPNPAQPAVLEGANAPAPSTEQYTQAKNVTQLYHESVEATYLAQSVPGRFEGVVTAGQTPTRPDYAAQIQRKLEKIAQDFNFSSLRGVYNNPANPAANALRSRGLLTAVTTNVMAKSGTPQLAEDDLADLYRLMIDNSGVQPDQLILMANTYQVGRISKLFKDYHQQQSQTVAGLGITQILTPFGLVRVSLELDMPQGEIAFVNPNVIRGVYNQVPNKPSALFFEELAKVGSSDRGQLYGQMGLDHGPEWAHGKITGLATAAS